MINDSEKNVSASAPQKKRNYSWLSLLLGFSIFPIIFFAGPLLASLPQGNDTSIHIGLLIGLLAILLQLVGFVLGVIGIVRGPERIISGLGALLCFLFCLLVIDKLFK